MRSLGEIDDFGGTAAEDDDIKRFFVRTPAFDDIQQGKRHVVVGRKGSGKTALYRALLEHAEPDRAKGLTFKQYPWAAHYRYASTEVDASERFVSTWTFLILVETFSLLIKSPPDGLSRAQTRSLSAVQGFLEKNYGTSSPDFKKAFPEGGLKLEGITVAPAVMGNQIGGVDVSRSAGLALGGTLQRVTEWMAEQLVVIGPNTPPIWILFDELDLGFNPRDSEYGARVAGLLIAARSFVIDFTRAGIPVHPVVFLRSDIFEGLYFGDKNKIVNSETIELLWHDRMDYEGSSLKHLIDWRINETLELDDLDGAWAAAFDPQLTRGTQHKFQHMTFRTFLRPRDLIQFANLAVAETQRRDKDSTARISNSDLKDARTPYSRYLLRELDDEIAEAVPNWRHYLEVIKSMGFALFTMEDFEAGYEQASHKVHCDRSALQLMDFFFHFSIIGFERKAPGGSGLAHHFRYQDETILFEPSARTFLVHRGLKEVLGLRETAGSSD